MGLNALASTQLNSDDWVVLAAAEAYEKITGIDVSNRVPAATRDVLGSATGRVVAVGTTSVRALESAAALGRADGRTELFIHRPYDWQVVDVLMTNFHLPRTTLLMMIDAFVGPRWRRLYDAALAEGYRFLSCGDAMLLDRHANRAA